MMSLAVTISFGLKLNAHCSSFDSAVIKRIVLVQLFVVSTKKATNVIRFSNTSCQFMKKLLKKQRALFCCKGRAQNVATDVVTHLWATHDMIEHCAVGDHICKQEKRRPLGH